MFAEFETFIRERTDLSDADIEVIRSLAIEKIVRKKESLLHAGEVCRYKMFVSKGLLRTFCTKEDGSDYILQFSPENSWTTDPESFDKLIPSVCNIDALEYSEVIMWTKEDFNYLFANIPGLKAYTQKLIVQNMYVVRQRVLSVISSTPEEKYDEFIKNYPNVFARVPLHMVASYLGVSTKTLSRIRHAQLVR
ncbi:Crp/Fnr family transcriptional regulator [Mucilaginibacter sp. X4EP1]|uniref:Crp/Fnr family transcriptional regulator n=1 Tax=Mucilaginibacter sp. X4EP1 TaxID=2723092 RepID=UPI0021694A5B|nr:Crp/Fnr family transcriptional regulator [Mucilaginibacter sp. X4EP1]MCS3815063.1 CRP-like cAMP-binding protein [Mucilaginibacter sp. X4EP1]